MPSGPRGEASWELGRTWESSGTYSAWAGDVPPPDSMPPSSLPLCPSSGCSLVRHACSSPCTSVAVSRRLVSGLSLCRGLGCVVGAPLQPEWRDWPADRWCGRAERGLRPRGVIVTVTLLPCFWGSAFPSFLITVSECSREPIRWEGSGTERGFVIAVVTMTPLFSAPYPCADVGCCWFGLQLTGRSPMLI